MRPPVANPFDPNVPAILFVEGADDVVFFKALVSHLQLSSTIQVILYGVQEMGKVQGGKDQLKLGLTTLKNDSGFKNNRYKAIGIVRDADQDLKDSFEHKVCGVLERLKLPVPTEVLTFTPTLPRIGVFMMPPNKEGTGQMLEDLLWAYFLDNNDPLIPCVEQYIGCLQNLVPENRIPKTKFYALIAAKKDPADEENPYPTFKRHVKDWDSPVFGQLRAFLQQLAKVNP